MIRPCVAFLAIFALIFLFPLCVDGFSSVKFEKVGDGVEEFALDISGELSIRGASTLFVYGLKNSNEYVSQGDCSVAVDDTFVCRLFHATGVDTVELLAQETSESDMYSIM